MTDIYSPAILESIDWFKVKMQPKVTHISAVKGWRALFEPNSSNLDDIFQVPAPHESRVASSKKGNFGVCHRSTSKKELISLACPSRNPGVSSVIPPAHLHTRQVSLSEC